MIKLENLSVGYQKTVVSDINAKITKGRFVAVLGKNGCGKSTLIKTIAGIFPAHRGEIFIGDKRLGEYAPTGRAREISYLPQSRILSNISVERLVLHGRFPHMGYPRKYQKHDWICVEQALEKMGISHLRKNSILELSGGQRQKAFLAMAIVQDAPVMLLDEPTTYLDISCQHEVMTFCKVLSMEGKTVMMVLHDIQLALAFADEIMILDDGKMCGHFMVDNDMDTSIIEQVFGIRLYPVSLQDKRQYVVMKKEGLCAN